MTDGHAANIVVIDDTDVVRRLLVMQLRRLGHEVREAADGQEGLELLRSQRPDLVLCDLRMPRMDGLDFLRATQEHFAGLPVIVISGEGVLGDAISALKLGAWDYITKPIELAALEHAVAKALEKAKLLEENRSYARRLEELNRELTESLRMLADDENAGRQIQFRMLPRNHLKFGDYEVSRELVPSAFLSGDFIDAFTIDQEHWGFYLADVSGHGVSSALVTVLLRTFVHRQVESHVRSQDGLILQPARLLERLNEEMAREDLDKHLTIFFGVVTLGRHSLDYANAGHFPWPLLYDGAEARWLERPGVPVGLMPGTQYSQDSIPLSSTLTLAVFTDGLLEGMPEPDLDSKLDRLKTYFGRESVTVEGALADLLPQSRSSLPDDVAILLIKRGIDHGNRSSG